MSTINYYNQKPSRPNLYDSKSNTIRRCICKLDRYRYAVINSKDGATLKGENIDKPVSKIVQDRNLLPADGIKWEDFIDIWPGFVFKYYFVYDSENESFIKDFISLHQTHIQSYNNKKILSGFATFNDAKEMGNRQNIIKRFIKNESNIFWYQAIVDNLYHTESLELESNYPNSLERMNFDIGNLYQTNDKKASLGVNWDIDNIKQRHA